MLPEDDYDRNMQERFKCFNVNFRLLKTIYVHLLVCYLNVTVKFPSSPHIPPVYSSIQRFLYRRSPRNCLVKCI